MLMLLAAGFKTKKKVNQCLYQLEKEGLVKQDKVSGRKPTWRLHSCKSSAFTAANSQLGRFIATLPTDHAHGNGLSRETKAEASGPLTTFTNARASAPFAQPNATTAAEGTGRNSVPTELSLGDKILNLMRDGASMTAIQIAKALGL